MQEVWCAADRHNEGCSILVSTMQEVCITGDIVMHTKRIGKIAEMRVAAKLLELGYDVFLAATEDLPVDMVAYVDGEFIRIQVKSRIPKDNVIHVELYSSTQKYRKQYTVEDVDWVILYDPSSDHGYKIDLHLISDQKSICLRTGGYTKNNQYANVHLAEQYMIF